MAKHPFQSIPSPVSHSGESQNPEGQGNGIRRRNHLPIALTEPGFPAHGELYRRTKGVCRLANQTCATSNSERLRGCSEKL